MFLRVRLNKRRKAGKTSNTRLVVKYRNLNAAEAKQEKIRLKGLRHVAEDEDDEEEGIILVPEYFNNFKGFTF